MHFFNNCLLIFIIYAINIVYGFSCVFNEKGGIFMDITALSSSMSFADVNSQVGIAVLAKNLDTIETLGDGMKKMMEMSVNPNLGANIDVQV